MKKIVYLIILCLSFSYTKNADDSRWRGFFGVEGGVGMMDTISLFFIQFTSNTGLFKNDYGLRGLSYGAGIVGGWQKYTYEKVGMRNTLGLRIFGTKNTKSGNIEDTFLGDVKFANETKSLIIDVVPYYALDGLFDFVKSGDNRFGMSLGFEIDVLHLSFLKNLVGFAFVGLSSRLGFYTQFDRNMIELNATIPLASLNAGKAFAYNSTLTLSYKYLF